MERSPQPQVGSINPINVAHVPGRSSSENYIHSVMLSFIPVSGVFLLLPILNRVLSSEQTSLAFYILIMGALVLTANLLSYMTLSSIMDFKIYWRASLLTNTFLLGCMLHQQQQSAPLVCFGYYLMVLSFFHMSEFVVTALYNQGEVSTDSFLINHSMEYGAAMLVSWCEFFVEMLLFPALKVNMYARFCGLFLCMFGEVFRKLAMYTCGTNFNHYVQERRKDGHVLVKNGIYSLVRHPSYFGWFYWSVGTQVLLANPICLFLYAYASWKFFNTRIAYEEFHLIKFFGREYTTYQKQVSTGIPFISGYTIEGDDNLD